VDVDALRVDALRVEVRRVADRLRSMSQERLNRPFPPYASRAAAALALAQLLADTAQDLAGPAGHGEGARRFVPDLGPLAVGDQVAVTGTDLVIAAARLTGDDDRVQGCLEALGELRRAL
jgi:hypothetical protein